MQTVERFGEMDAHVNLLMGTFLTVSYNAAVQLTCDLDQTNTVLQRSGRPTKYRQDSLTQQASEFHAKGGSRAVF